MNIQDNIFIGKKLNIRKKYTVKSNINNIDVLDDSKGKIKILDFKGETKINKIISPSLKEIRNYTGIIDDNLISDCPNLDTIYFDKNTVLDISYNIKNKFKKLYIMNLYDSSKFNNILNHFDEKYIITKLKLTYEFSFKCHCEIMLENDFEKCFFKDATIFIYFNDSILKKDTTKYCLKKVYRDMIKSNTLHIPEKYSSIDIENLDDYKIDTIVINKAIDILGSKYQYKNINSIYFKDFKEFYTSSFDKLKNLKYIRILENNNPLEIQIPNGYHLIGQEFKYTNDVSIYCSNGSNIICYNTKYYNMNNKTTKTIILNDNSEYYNKYTNIVDIPNGYDHVIIDFNNIDNLNLSIKADKNNIPIIHFHNPKKLNKLFVKYGGTNTLDGEYHVDINDTIYTATYKKDQFIILEGILSNYVVSTIENYYEKIEKRPSFIIDDVLLSYQKKKKELKLNIKKLIK